MSPPRSRAISLPRMNLKPIVCMATVLLTAAKIAANGQPASCVVYFSVLENDRAPVQRSTLKMNEAQSSWYERYGNREKYEGICYVESGARAPADDPLYVMVWGEHLASEPYTYSYEATAAARGDGSGITTDQNGSTIRASAPLAQSSAQAKKQYVADGWLAVWNIPTSESQGRFVAIAPLRVHKRGDATVASTELLKDAMEQIGQREKARLAAIGKGWAVVTITPIDKPRPAASENASSTSQSSPDSVQPADPVQATGPEPPPSQASVVTSVVASAVKVTSSVPGAEIFVDENFVGNTPSIIDVKAGKHVITVKKTGFQDWVRIVDFSGGLVTLDVQLGRETNEMSAADPPTNPPEKSDGPTEPAADRASASTTEKPFGWIGVSTKNDRHGAFVTDVTAESPAAQAGIHVGDVILTLDGRPVKSEEFQTLVAAYKPGTRVPLSYARGSSTHEVWITVASETGLR